VIGRIEGGGGFMIEYHIGDVNDLEKIRELWEGLNRHHHERSRHFRHHYESWNFDDRKAYFEKLARSGKFRIDLAFDSDENRYVGYCVSSVSVELHGEMESIFIEEKYRSKGIGTRLVSSAVSWMDSQGAVRKRVAVADGNEEAWSFYERFGFFPRMTLLEQKG
jgi:ribosomal protein S18 acetylase RimI-like enzyme